MKKNISMILFTLALLTLVQLPALADIHDRIEYKLNRVLRDVEIINNDIAAECTVIHPEDFEDADGNLTQTYVIAAPGKYCLGGNVEFVPEDEFTPAIVILSDDVSLSLNGFTLSQANDTPDAYGVQIGQGYNYDDPDFVLKNITIFNGSITDFTAIGVFCYNGSFDGDGNELAFQDLHFFDLNILDCGSSPSNDFASGIDLDSSASTNLYDPAIKGAYKNVIIENCNVNRCLGNASIQVYTGDNVVVTDTQANDLTSIRSIIFGFDRGPSSYILACRNVQMSNCQGNGTKDLDPNVAFALCGSRIDYSINISIKDSQFNDNFGEASRHVVGAFFSNVQNGIFENCQFNNPRGGPSSTAIEGVHMSDGPLQQTEGNGIKFINCQFNGATRDANGTPRGGITFCAGTLLLTLRNIIFENCQAVNISTEHTRYDSFGFCLGTLPQDPIPAFADGRNFVFSNCVVSDITSLSKKSIGIFFAVSNINRIGEQASLYNTVVENCIIERIRSDSSTEITAGIAEGLLDFNLAQSFPAQFNLFIKGCRVSDVRSNTDNPSPLSAGIVVQSVHRPILQNNSVSDCDRGILFTGTDTIRPNGFQLAATLEDALAFPPVFIDLNTIPAAAPTQDFFNITQGNSVTVAPSGSTINTTLDFILPVANLTALGWQPGDEIFYDCNGGSPISDLVCTTTYFLIVYIPGFSENGVVQQNEVDNCSISGYQDDAPTTLSAWVDNTAFNDGTPASAAANYAITWAGVAPVDAGTLAAYPTPGSKYYNLSLIP